MSAEKPKRMSDEEFWRVSAACDCGCPANIRTGEEAERARASEKRLAEAARQTLSAWEKGQHHELRDAREALRAALSEVES